MDDMEKESRDERTMKVPHMSVMAVMWESGASVAKISLRVDGKDVGSPAEMNTEDLLQLGSLCKGMLEHIKQVLTVDDALEEAMNGLKADE